MFSSLKVLGYAEMGEAPHQEQDLFEQGVSLIKLFSSLCGIYMSDVFGENAHDSGLRFCLPPLFIGHLE